jgi:flagellar protein FliS
MSPIAMHTPAKASASALYSASASTHDDAQALWAGSFLEKNHSFETLDSSFLVSLRFLLCQDHKEQDIMRVHFKAMESYGEGNHTSQALVADKVELIQMLFDGLIDSLVTAKGHIQRGAIEDKNKSLTRAGRIVLGLQGSLDLDKGGDLARNLFELYSYVTRRLIHVNARNDLNALQEVHTLLNEIRQAWRDVPNLLPKTAPASGVAMSSMH